MNTRPLHSTVHSPCSTSHSSPSAFGVRHRALFTPPHPHPVSSSSRRRPTTQLQAIDAFWVSAGQASAVVGGIVGCTTIGAVLVRTSINRMIEQDNEQADLDQSQNSQQAEAATKRRTRLKPEELLGTPEQNGRPPSVKK